MNHRSIISHRTLLHQPTAEFCRSGAQLTGQAQPLPGTPRRSLLAEWLLKILLKHLDDLPVRLILRKSLAFSPPPSTQAIATVSISGVWTVVRLLLDPEIAFGNSYADGRITVKGDLVGLLKHAFLFMERQRPEPWYRKLLSHWLDRIQANTLTGSARNIHSHYDLTADFYKLWLDSRLVYTCGYFASPEVSLEEAQLAKMDHICRKLQLQPGETVVEAGCGWGALALHMAKHYGVRVEAFNISREQILIAREQARKEGLSSQVDFIEDDYRNISSQADVFVSVGMLEHVGLENYEELGRVIHRITEDSGRGLLHFIGRNRAGMFSPWIRRRMFPGAYIPALREMLGLLEPWNFAVLDVENLRLHYEKTLEHWLSRFEGNVEQVTTMFGPEFVRVWRLYLSGSIAAFRVGTLQLFQITFAGAACRQIPWTRAHLYARQNPHQLPAESKSEWCHAKS